MGENPHARLWSEVGFELGSIRVKKAGEKAGKETTEST